MAKWIEETDLTFPVGHVARRFVRVCTSRLSSPEHAVHIGDSKHDLVRRPGRALIVAKFTHDHLGTLAIDTELHAMGLADTNVLDQPEDLDVPGGRCGHIGHGENWDHPRPRR